MYMKTKIEFRWVPCPLIICQIFLQLHWSPPMVKSIDCYCGVLLFVAFQQGFNMKNCGTRLALRMLSVYSTAPDEIYISGGSLCKVTT